MNTEKSQQNSVSPIAAANHYLAGMSFWEARSKVLQDMVVEREIEIARLKSLLPPDPDPA